jgi:uncharacterized protein (DUF849 family)
MIHIHARTPDGVAVLRGRGLPRDHRGDRGAVDDVIVNYSTGAIGVPDREAHRLPARAAPDVAALNMGSMNYAKFSARRKEFVFHGLRELVRHDHGLRRAMSELGIRPSTSASTRATSPTSTRCSTWASARSRCRSPA